ncbi:MAG: hypothetical protein ACOYVK_00795 [Bacillota bacterium]
MSLTDQSDVIVKKAMTRLNVKNTRKKRINLRESELLVIAGILAGALTTFSVYVDANRHVSIVVHGDLVKIDGSENELDQIMGQVGTMPFDKVLSAMIKRIE